MSQLPLYVSLLYIVTTLIAIGIFYKASHHSKITLFVLLGWTMLQSVIGFSGFYLVTDTIPPRLVLAIGPPVLLIIVLFSTKKGQKYIDSLDAGALTLYHSVRVPIEFGLFLLFINKQIPELMTFEGRNFDILSGILGILVYYFGFVKKKLKPGIILAWNFIGLALLFNIVFHGILSVPTPFQQFGFEQPNVALLYFPFVWLPSLLVPLVLFAHLAVIRKLWKIKAVIPA
jgi:hypothetical protein